MSCVILLCSTPVSLRRAVVGNLSHLVLVKQDAFAQVLGWLAVSDRSKVEDL